MNKKITLNRSLSLPMIVLYGLGTTIGGGIYALVGEIAGVAGYFSPISFLIASLIAGFTALSFAELCSRFPRAAGVSLYIKQAFGNQHLSTIAGLLVIIAGLVSAAALVNGFVGYLNQLIGLDRITGIVFITVLLGGIAVWGIAESVTIASIVTIIEIGGLIFLIAVSGDGLAAFPEKWTQLLPPSDLSAWSGIYFGAVLAFYAFIGFEDMVDVAEEVKSVKRNLPLAILLTLGITTLMYLCLMVTAVLSLTPAQLAGSEAPLALLYEHHTGKKAIAISIIGMFAIINGALIQMIMASRVIYGLSSRGQLPAVLGKINHQTRTPLLATLLAASIVLGLSLISSLGTLAEITSFIMLIIFSLVNLALWKIKRCETNSAGALVVPHWIPVTGFVVSLLFALIEVQRFIEF